jgi:hypothetical protein
MPKALHLQKGNSHVNNMRNVCMYFYLRERHKCIKLLLKFATSYHGDAQL